MPAPTSQPRHRRYSVRWQARLDAETHATREVLAQTLQRKRGSILRYVMQWGLTYTQRWTIDPSIPDRPRLVHMLVSPELGQQVHDAAAAHGVSVAAWVRHAMRQVTLEDFPASWHVRETTSRSHGSGYFHRTFGLRLDEGTPRKLETLTGALGRSAAEVIRQLIAQAKRDDFPRSWCFAVEERRAQEGGPHEPLDLSQALSQGDGHDGRDPPLPRGPQRPL
jgi:hypothetical protein